MTIVSDRYTKCVLTVIAVALVALAVNPHLARLQGTLGSAVRPAEAQAQAQPAPAQPAPPPAPPATPVQPAPAQAPGHGHPVPAQAQPAPVPGQPPTQVPARPPVVAPGAPPQMPPSSLANFQWWDECVATSKETIPAAWGKLVDLAPGAFVFESDDTVRLVRTAPYESVPLGPNNKPCKMLEIKKTK
jgi:hypothetical protein